MGTLMSEDVDCYQLLTGDTWLEIFMPTLIHSKKVVTE